MTIPGNTPDHAQMDRQVMSDFPTRVMSYLPTRLRMGEARRPWLRP